MKKQEILEKFREKISRDHDCFVAGTRGIEYFISLAYDAGKEEGENRAGVYELKGFQAGLQAAIEIIEKAYLDARDINFRDGIAHCINILRISKRKEWENEENYII